MFLSAKLYRANPNSTSKDSIFQTNGAIQSRHMLNFSTPKSFSKSGYYTCCAVCSTFMKSTLGGKEAGDGLSVKLALTAARSKTYLLGDTILGLWAVVWTVLYK